MCVCVCVCDVIFLCVQIMADEFSHTVMHRNKPVARVAGGGVVYHRLPNQSK